MEYGGEEMKNIEEEIKYTEPEMEYVDEEIVHILSFYRKTYECRNEG